MSRVEKVGVWLLDCGDCVGSDSESDSNVSDSGVSSVVDELLLLLSSVVGSSLKLIN